MATGSSIHFSLLLLWRLHCIKEPIMVLKSRICARSVVDRTGGSIILKSLELQRKLQRGNDTVKGAAFWYIRSLLIYQAFLKYFIRAAAQQNNSATGLEKRQSANKKATLGRLLYATVLLLCCAAALLRIFLIPLDAQSLHPRFKRLWIDA